ncbi:MAG: hypothetical protein IJW29_00140 [Clostridia bacterium]|nr:hypothetical protein [Clostridia bacterium]
MNRIEALRRVALQSRCCYDEFYYRFYKCYAHSDLTDEYARYTEAFVAAFAETTVHITDGELIVGETVDGMSEADRAAWETVYKPLSRERAKRAGSGQDSHMAIDYELVLSRGLRGIIARIEELELDCVPESRAFYASAKGCLLAVIAHAERYADHALHLAERESDPVRRDELLQIARICRRVPAEPASSFYEAVQSVHFISYCLSFNPLRPWHQQFQLGHPDRYLLPYYERDLQSGAITRERAQLLLDCLGVQINMRVPRGLSSGYMVGGRSTDGKTVANDLTDMLMRVVDNVRLVYPAVGLCYHADMPECYLKTACEILSHGRSHPAIFNDDVITRGLCDYGVPEDEAHNYIHSTCVEITPVASSNVWVASPYVNMAQLLLDTMTREYESFDAHVSAIKAEIDRRIGGAFRYFSDCRRTRAENSINPLLSCLVNDCLSRGLDIENGGARYNWIMPSFVGMANLVDSLYAVKHLVYDEKEMTLCELKAILDADFEGNEPLRRRLLDGLPKYGNDCDEIDGYFSTFIDHIVAECRKHTPPFSEGRLIPSVFCWIKHEEFGRVTGATPDGRRAGFPLGDGSGPCQGREKRGPTASILSSTKWDHSALIGGVAVNMKFSKRSLGAKSTDVMAALVKTYLSRGGFEMQINVTDRDLLLRAQAEPEQYRDLIVRIGGYSDYFTKLSPQMQAEVILRTEHKI